MQFDIRTLLVAVAFATAFCAAARFLLWRMHPRMPGLAHWAYAGVAAFLALVLIVPRTPIAGISPLALAQLSVVAGLILAWDGFRRFVDRPPLSPAVLVTLAAVTLALVVLAHIERSLAFRAWNNAVLIAALSTLIAYELISAAKPGQLAIRATGWAYAANAVFFLLRAITLTHGGETGNEWNPDGFAAYPLFWWLCMAVATTLGMVLMTGERLQNHLDWQASHDPLTGAFNRRAFAFLAEKALAHARRHRQPLSVLMMDLDHFKQINDQQGHHHGDAILYRFANTATRVLRGGDVFCRFGGEEFLALLPSTTAEHALIAAERIRRVFVEQEATTDTATGAQPSAVTVSIGVGELAENEDIHDVLRRADTALYRAKSLGRNRCELATDADKEMGGAADMPLAARSEP